MHVLQAHTGVHVALATKLKVEFENIVPGTVEATGLKLVRYGDKVVFQAANGKYVTAFQDGSLKVQATTIQGWEQFDEAGSVMLGSTTS